MLKKIKSCYISTSGGSNLRELRRILQEREISVVNPDGVHSPVLAPSEFASSLQDADIVIGILSRERRSDWALFELGAAWANGRQILLVLPPRASLGVLSALKGVLVVRANPSNGGAIAFALDQLLAAPARASSDATETATRLSLPIGESADSLLLLANVAINSRDGRALEEVVARALEMSKLSGVVREAQGKQESRNVDFAVWADELSGAVGNPLLIEVRSGSTSIKGAAQQLSTAVAAAGGGYGLLIYGAAVSSLPPSHGIPSNVLVLSVIEFLDGLRLQSFPALVRKLRNQRMHGVG